MRHPIRLVLFAFVATACTGRSTAAVIEDARVAREAGGGVAWEDPPLLLASAADPEPETAAPPPDPAPDPESLSPLLSCGLRSPMPGGVTMGYAADTGLDIAGMKLPVFAIAAGTIVYAEAGHTLWSSPRDTDLAVLLELDEPIGFGDRQVTHVWYAHLSKLEFEQAEHVEVRRRVVAGERLGVSGVANGAWHIHLGLLLDGDTSQRWGTFLLEDDARKVLCGLRAVQRLPKK